MKGVGASGVGALGVGALGVGALGVSGLGVALTLWYICVIQIIALYNIDTKRMWLTCDELVQCFVQLTHGGLCRFQFRARSLSSYGDL